MYDNQDLISVLLARNNQNSSNFLVVRPPTPYDEATTAGIACNPPPHANVFTAAQAYAETNVKMQNILKRWNDPSISDKGSCVVQNLIHNAYISEVILTSVLDMEKSSDDPRIELDSYDKMVVLE